MFYMMTSLCWLNGVSSSKPACNTSLKDRAQIARTYFFVLWPGSTEPVGTNPETLGTGHTGLDRFRFRSVPKWSKFKFWISIQKMKKSHKILKNTSRCVWPPGFLINPNSRSTPADSGQITINLGPHLEKLTNQLYWTLLTSRHTCGANPWSKTWSNPTSPLVSIPVFRNFCRVLQNSPKHLKFYLWESCPSCWGTQLSCRLTFQIWRGKAWKTWPKVSMSCSWTCVGIQSWQLILAKSVEKNPI
jgi:hypothetical protein